jgi:hypothetical protein
MKIIRIILWIWNYESIDYQHQLWNTQKIYMMVRKEVFLFLTKWEEKQFYFLESINKMACAFQLII